jgi:hypothetical protein
MARNATQANNGKATDNLDMASENVAAKIGDTVEKFGKEVQEKAIVSVRTALSTIQEGEKEVRNLQGLIERKQSGNAMALLSLASDCVRLTMKGNRAQLGDAADLMAAACSFAEDELISSDAKVNGGVKRKLNEIISSWRPLKSDMLNAMRKAHLNPLKFADKPTEMRNAYKEFLQTPAGKAAASSRGRSENSNATTKVDVPARVAAAAKKMNKLTDSARSVVNHLLQVLQGKDEDSQNLCAAELETFIKIKLESLEAEEDEGSEDSASLRGRARANPVRESERPQAS